MEFDRRCSTERRHDPLTIMDGTGRVLALRSGLFSVFIYSFIRPFVHPSTHITSNLFICPSIHPTICFCFCFFLGREWSDWSQELRVQGEELRWKFTSDGSVNGWGWLFTVYPIMPAAAPLDMLSDRTILSRPSIDLVTCLLDFKLESTMDHSIVPRLAASLAACAQLSCLSEYRSPYPPH